MSGRYARTMSPREEDEQKALAGFLNVLGVLWCHVPNEGRFSVQYLAKRKALGVKAGVPDVLIFTLAPSIGKPVAIELKSTDPHATVKPSQAEWLAALQRVGWETAVCYGADVAIEYLKRLGYRAGGDFVAKAREGEKTTQDTDPSPKTAPRGTGEATGAF